MQIRKKVGIEIRRGEIIIGTTAEDDLKFGISQQDLVMNILNEELGLGLHKNPNIYDVDCIDKDGKYYEIKWDCNINYSENFLIEIMASIYPKELGWFYRYDKLDFLVLTNDRDIFVFDWKAIREYCIENIETAKLVLGVENNKQGLILLFPFEKIKNFIKYTFHKWSGKGHKQTLNEIPQIKTTKENTIKYELGDNYIL